MLPFELHRKVMKTGPIFSRMRSANMGSVKWTLLPLARPVKGSLSPKIEGFDEYA